MVRLPTHGISPAARLVKAMVPFLPQFPIARSYHGVQLTKSNRTSAKRSVAEAVAIAIATSDWTTQSANDKVQSLFRKKQPWIKTFVQEVIGQSRERIALKQLTTITARNLTLKQAIKDHNLQPVKIERLKITGALAALDWRLPKYENISQFADQLGMSWRELQWLACIANPPCHLPEHYVSTWIRKRSAGLRLIESPKSKLKHVQQIILRDVLNLIPPHSAVHGFRQHRNVGTFASNHLGQPFCLRMDLKDFFASVRGGRVFGMFRAAGYKRELARMFTRLSTTRTSVEVINQIRWPGASGACEASRLYLASHLPQGAPTSPALANLAAYNFDCRLCGLADSVGARYSRYADDLLFSGDENFSRSAKRFAISVGAIAIEEGFEVNFRKTRYQPASQRQFAAGVVLNCKANIKRSDFDQLKAILHNCAQHGPESQNRDLRPNFRQHLLGRINWVRQINRARADKLQRIFDRIQWDVDGIELT